MKHLNEEQLIDVLMGETNDEALLDHLSNCETCADSMVTLQMGLDAARKVKPKVPLMAVPVISYDKFARQRKQARTTWLAVAAMFLLAIMGFRVEVGKKGVVIQFALFHQNSSSDDTRIAALEENFMTALEIQSNTAQNQINARFDNLLLENSQELGEFSTVINRKFDNNSLEYDRKLTALEEEIIRQYRNDKAKGSLR